MDRAARLLGNLLVVAVVGASAHGAEPNVGFDVSYIVACEDVTPEAFVQQSPDEKVIEAKVRVSSRFSGGTGHGVREIVVVIWSPERRLRVVDFAPRSQLTSDIEGSIDVVEKGEDAHSLDSSVSAQLSPLSSVRLTPSAGATKSHLEHLQQTYRRRPPQQLILAAGIAHREHGVFFKLKPSSQESLEGQREFVCRFVVPKSWRADYVLVACRAVPEKRPLLSGTEDCGRMFSLVGLYMRSDSEARDLARQAAEAYEGYAATAESQGQALLSDDRPSRELHDLLPGLRLIEALFEGLGVDLNASARRRNDARAEFNAALATLIGLTG